MPDLAPVLASAGDSIGGSPDSLPTARRPRRADRSNGNTGIRVRQLSLPGSGLIGSELARIDYKSVSSLIPQALNLSPFRDALSKQSLRSKRQGPLNPFSTKV